MTPQTGREEGTVKPEPKLSERLENVRAFLVGSRLHPHHDANYELISIVRGIEHLEASDTAAEAMRALKAQIEADRKKRWEKFGIQNPAQGKEFTGQVYAVWVANPRVGLEQLKHLLIEDLEDQRILALIDESIKKGGGK